MDSRQLVNSNDVISVSETDLALIDNKTFKADEFLTVVSSELFSNYEDEDELGKNGVLMALNVKYLVLTKLGGKERLKFL